MIVMGGFTATFIGPIIVVVVKGFGNVTAAAAAEGSRRLQSRGPSVVKSGATPGPARVKTGAVLAYRRFAPLESDNGPDLAFAGDLVEIEGWQLVAATASIVKRW